MDTDWKEWGVVRTIEGLHAPRFLLGNWETVEEFNRETRALVEEHWSQFRGMLSDEGNASDEGISEVEGSGYAALCRLQERLDSRHEKIQESLEEWEFEANLRKLIIAGFKQKVKEIAVERATDSEGSEPSEEELKDAWEHVLDRPMGEAWPPDELDLPITLDGDGWQVSLIQMRAASEEPKPPQISDLSIQYLPEDDALEWAGIDPDSVSRFEIRSFDGDTTWSDALERLGKRFDTYETQREQYERSLKVIEFRRRILKNVLHQFETYGSVEEMTEEKAGEIVQEELPDVFEEGSKPLEYAAEIVQKYRRTPSSLPDGSNKMSKFKENWVPDSPNARGDSKVGMLQREIRNANLSDKYSDPESFCDLLERLLERHHKD